MFHRFDAFMLDFHLDGPSAEQWRYTKGSNHSFNAFAIGAGVLGRALRSSYKGENTRNFALVRDPLAMTSCNSSCLVIQQANLGLLGYKKYRIFFPPFASGFNEIRWLDFSSRL